MEQKHKDPDFYSLVCIMFWIIRQPWWHSGFYRVTQDMKQVFTLLGVYAWNNTETVLSVEECKYLVQVLRLEQSIEDYDAMILQKETMAQTLRLSCLIQLAV